jgi:RimJ/RimL family protein N-acetyltransferase
MLSLGMDDDELVAIAAVEKLGEGAEFFHILVVATSLGQRGRGLGVSAIDRAITCAAQRAHPELPRLIVTANVHILNVASQTCFERSGFVKDGTVIDGLYEQWILGVEIEG